jgi:hypothetical protein
MKRVGSTGFLPPAPEIDFPFLICIGSVGSDDNGWLVFNGSY